MTGEKDDLRRMMNNLVPILRLRILHSNCPSTEEEKTKIITVITDVTNILDNGF